jgi:superfamily II DNA or RNA helicase
MNSCATVVGSTAAQGLQTTAVLADTHFISPPPATSQAPADRPVPIKSELRPHQVELLDEIDRALAAGARRIIGQAPTGFGKTMVASTIAGRSSGRLLAWAKSQPGRAM